MSENALDRKILKWLHQDIKPLYFIVVIIAVWPYCSTLGDRNTFGVTVAP
jgi:hypothetical protein